MKAYRDTPVLTAAAWCGTELVKEQWVHNLTPGQVDALGRTAQELEARGVHYLATGSADYSLPEFNGLSDELLATLEGGLGFALVRGFPVESYDEETLIRMFWGLCAQVGTPEPQDAAGNRLHHVRDTGESLEKKSDLRAYQTNRAINYHNDGSDVFALLCVRQAASGGRSKLVSAVSVFNEILARRPDLARVLQEPFVFDARGQQLPGAPPCQAVPIYSFHAGYLNVLYKREYIDLAQRFDTVPPLTSLQVEALDLMDAVCDELALEFELKPGDLLMANNYDLLHARAAFKEQTTAGPGRHMLRIWMSIPNGRPLPEVFAGTREFHHSYTRRLGS